jgi:hypothetical protein
VRPAGRARGDLAISGPERNRWDACDWFYCDVPGCRRKALGFWRATIAGRHSRHAECGMHTGSEVNGFAHGVAAAVATWRAVAQGEAHERDRTHP